MVAAGFGWLSYRTRIDVLPPRTIARARTGRRARSFSTAAAWTGSPPAFSAPPLWA